MVNTLPLVLSADYITYPCYFYQCGLNEYCSHFVTKLKKLMAREGNFTLCDQILTTAPSYTNVFVVNMNEID